MDLRTDTDGRGHSAPRQHRNRGASWTRRTALGRTALAGAVVGAGALGASLVAVPAVVSSEASAAPSVNASLVWSKTLPDAGSPVAQSSPTEATLDGSGPSVVVGDRAGKIYAFHLSDGSTPAGSWPASTGGVPVDSTPSVASVDGNGLDTVFVGAGNAANPNEGGYYAFNSNGSQAWFHNATNPSTDQIANNGVQASMAVGTLGGVTAVVAPSLGQNEYAFNAATGAVLPGWPFFTADSGFSTPSLINGQVVEGETPPPGSPTGPRTPTEATSGW